MANIDDLLLTALGKLPPKPRDDATREVKKRYSEAVSNAVAQAFGEELRGRGLTNALPALPGDTGLSGAERRLAGGIGAKKVDVTWATEESGLIFGISIKTINFRDKRSKNFQKNLTNRRGDMLFEAVTLHRRFPYAVLAGFFCFDKDAERDQTVSKKGKVTRQSTFKNAHARLKLFTGRTDPAGRDEQFEKLYVILLDASTSSPKVRAFEAGAHEKELALADIFDTLVAIIAERNPDFYECVDGTLAKTAAH